MEHLLFVFLRKFNSFSFHLIRSICPCAYLHSMCTDASIVLSVFGNFFFSLIIHSSMRRNSKQGRNVCGCCSMVSVISFPAVSFSLYWTALPVSSGQHNKYKQFYLRIFFFIWKREFLNEHRVMDLKIYRQFWCVWNAVELMETEIFRNFQDY